MPIYVQQEDFEPSGWWRVLGPDGRIWCETSNEKEARDRMREGDTLFRQWVLRLSDWRKVDSE